MSNRKKSHRINSVALLCAAFAFSARQSAGADALQLVVSPFSGAVQIVNPTTSFSPVPFDGYEVGSPSGSLTPATWQSLTAAGVPGWNSVPTSNKAVGELNLTSSTSVAVGSAFSLGVLTTASATVDLQFAYTQPTPQGAETLVAGAVQDSGGGLSLSVHNLLSNHGASIEQTAVIIGNGDLVPISTDGYTVQSPSGNLNPAHFSGFTGHSVSGWNNVTTSTTGLGELNLSSSTSIAPGHDQPLGSILTNSATQDLVFSFEVPGKGVYARNVVYSNELAGDVNHDNIVNGLDVNLIATNWLHSGTLAGDANYDGIVNGLDVNLLASNWLNTISPGGGSGAATVPEPSTIALAVLALCTIVCRRVIGAPKA
jgi:hypothetical protein